MSQKTQFAEEIADMNENGVFPIKASRNQILDLTHRILHHLQHKWEQSSDEYGLEKAWLGGARAVWSIIQTPHSTEKFKQKGTWYLHQDFKKFHK